MTRNHTGVSFRHYCNYCNYYCSNEPYYYVICNAATKYSCINPFIFASNREESRAFTCTFLGCVRSFHCILYQLAELQNWTRA